MAISNATRLSDFGSGIGTQGAIIQVDNANQRVGIGTSVPEYTLDVKGTLNATTLGLTNLNVTGIASVGTGVTVYGAGIVSATSANFSGNPTLGAGVTVYSSGIISATTFDGNLTGNPTLGAGVTVYSSGIISATSYNIGINSAGTSIASEIKTLNFVGTGNTFKVSGNTVDVSISGGAGGASKIYDSTVFAYQNVVESDITIESPYKVATFYTSPDVTIDIEDDVTITVDSGCTLLAIDI